MQKGILKTVAVLGSGGREHALAWKIAQSAGVERVKVIPGNAGMPTADGPGSKLEILKCKIHPPFDELIALLQKEMVDFVVVGPDQFLADGVVDALSARGIAVFGPTKAAAQLEWSKLAAKEVLQKAGVPTASTRKLSAGTEKELSEIAEAWGGFPLVLKVDGLALGKGVQVCANLQEAVAFVQRGGASVFAERYLRGREMSLFAVCDGKDYVLLEPACDYKRLLAGGEGPNTGGMGAISPVPWISTTGVRKLGEQIFPAVLREMNQRGTPFRGLLYAGLMVEPKLNQFWVLEFNVRFGDPETQAILFRLESDLIPVLCGAAHGNVREALKSNPLRWSTKSAVNVVAASYGYPESPRTGEEIADFDVSRKRIENAGGIVFTAGLERVGSRIFSSGGRVLSVSGRGDSLEATARQVQSWVTELAFQGMSVRSDIGLDQMES